MEKQIVFGDSIGDRWSGATIIFSIKTKKGETIKSISHNEVSYWVYDCLFDIDAKIYKNTPEGKYIHNLIKSGSTSEEIYDYINKLILSRLEPQVLIDYIQSTIKIEKEESFQEGVEYKLNQLKNVLGISYN